MPKEWTYRDDTDGRIKPGRTPFYHQRQGSDIVLVDGTRYYERQGASIVEVTDSDAVVFNPSDFGTVHAHFDASYPGSFEIVDGLVATWYDLENSNDVSQPNTTRRPTLVSNYTVFFNSVEYLFNTLPLTRPSHIIAVVSLPLTTSNGAFVKVGDGADGIGIGFGGTSMDNQGNNLVGIAEQLTWEPFGIFPPINTIAVLSYYHVGGAAPTLFYNGTKYTRPVKPINNYDSGISIGGYASSGPVRAGICNIYEVVIYTGLLSDENVTEITSILTEKWNG